MKKLNEFRFNQLNQRLQIDDVKQT